MPDQAVYHLDIFIDHLTNSIRDNVTGESFETRVAEITKDEFKNVRKKKGEWHFDWKTEFRQSDRKVYKLIIADKPAEIHGLVSISDMGDHCYLHLAESAPMNFGKNKHYVGVGGNLFAFCCKLSYESGNDGIIAFKSKTKLIRHYEETLGAIHIGGHNMIIYPNEALNLVKKYFKG